MSFLYEPTFWFALISTSCTIINITHSYYLAHKKPNIFISWYYDFIGQTTFAFTIHNSSTETISIISVDVALGSKLMTADTFPRHIYKKLFTSKFPINIPPHESANIMANFSGLPKYVTHSSRCHFVFNISNKLIGYSFINDQKQLTTEQLNLISNQ